MKKSTLIRIIFTVLLLAATVLGLSSCKSNKEEETTANTNISTTYFAAVGTTAAPQSTQEDENTETVTSTTESTTQMDDITLPSELMSGVTVTQEQPEQTAETPVVATGVLTVTDSNKTIIYPAQLNNSQQKYPVIAWANGTGSPTQLYTALLEELAKGGYIVVADSSVMAADGTSQIDSINYIINKNSDESSVFYNKVNTAAIGVCGHSQGGRSCVNAAQADLRIRCAVSLAGASSAEEASGLTTPILFLTGTSDLIVVSSQWCQPSYDAVSGRAAYASLKGGIHTTYMTTPQKVSGYVLNWFDAYLKNDSAAKSVFTDGGKLSKDAEWQDFQNKN